MARPQRNTLFLHPTTTRVEDDCQKVTGGKKVEFKYSTRQETGFRESGP